MGEILHFPAPKTSVKPTEYEEAFEEKVISDILSTPVHGISSEEADKAIALRFASLMKAHQASKADQKPAERHTL